MLYKHPLNFNNKNDSAVILFDFVKENSTVLDVGCACGNLGEKLHKLKKCTLFGIEYNPQSAAKALAKNVYEQVNILDLNSLDDVWSIKHFQHFDYIILGDVLEHLLSPVDVLNKLKPCLKENGEFLISLPNAAHGSIKANLLLNHFDYTEIRILDKTHLRFYTAFSIAQMLSENNLSVIELKTTLLPPDGYQQLTLKNLPSEIASFILADPQSHIMQFVFRCKNNPKTVKKLFKDNIKYFKFTQNIGQCSLQGVIFKLKRLIITRFPKLLKLIETIR